MRESREHKDIWLIIDVLSKDANAKAVISFMEEVCKKKISTPLKRVLRNTIDQYREI